MKNLRSLRTKRLAWSLLSISSLCLDLQPAFAQTLPGPATIGPVQLSDQPEIDAGFHLLYELKFPGARAKFTDWENAHPGEALGPAAEAASYLFQEFDRQGVLTSDFFLDDKRLLGGIEGTPDPNMRSAFEAAIQKSQDLAHARLTSNPDDADALFALTISTGMLADYAGLIEGKQMETLRLTREADSVARNLLAVSPGATDAYVALGAANYLMGCLPAYKRFIIWFGGYHGDRGLGMHQLGLTAANGHYLRPYAKLALGLAAMREKQWALARTEFEQLTAEFPDNPKFAVELAKVRANPRPAASLH